MSVIRIICGDWIRGWPRDLDGNGSRLIPTLIRDIIGLKVVKNTLNYGANRVRYLTPVPAASRLRGRVEVMAAEDVPPNALRVTYKVTIEIEGGKRPACVAEVIGQHYR